ncbi:Hypothetical predicted protein [Paramuricea clavata]|uniref:Uncharacterized protein n=1 Tax=Paramuricea clavata TaxID=317549 RepID=A0A7D9DEV2_PARCT|nr:Hypothetical predicted protein [Paramuricea clavata]
MFEQDFSEKKREKPISLEDRKFLNITKKKLAESRLGGLKAKFAKDVKYKRDYMQFMDMVKKGYAKKAPQTDGKPCSYLDDGLKCSVVEMCQKGEFPLHKFTENEREVIESIPVDYRATEVKELDLSHDILRIERVLGVAHRK